ncbi:MAG: U32 family peptidase [Nanoarchaeota archaeon]|nr:U32 family peptidase [Nanoarchaeota archaeon]
MSIKKTHKIPTPELLSPVGNFQTLHAAIKAGCDAVYLGLKEFSMRDSAKNFTLTELKKVHSVCSSSNVKLYLTLNTIIYSNEIPKLSKLIPKAKSLVDAIICWDPSVIQLCKKYKIPFFISTQASVSNQDSAKFYKKLGAKRIIPARELNIKQMKQLSKIIPIEIFCHGALCVSYSGRCFTSQFLHCKSANRGMCQQPCRESYTITDKDGNKLKLENSKVMSAKDLCTLPFIDKLKPFVSSFKIEGRNRDPEYVFAVTSAYRQAIDKKLTKSEINKLLKELEKVYNRGFSLGFYINSPTSDDLSKSDHGEQTQSKQFIGKVFKFWPKPKVAGIHLNAGKLKVGDEILIIGKETFIQTKIISMEIDGKSVSEIKKGEDVGIKLPNKVRVNDEVYLVVENK